MATSSILTRVRGGAPVRPRCALIAGASGGIGEALCRSLVERFGPIRLVRLARRVERLPPCRADCVDLGFDLLDEQSMTEALARMPADVRPDWVFVATGWLHDAERMPEKTYRQLDPDALVHAYRINAVGPALLLKHLLPRLDRDGIARVGVLSARVGSVSDNRLGGWHAYRASKSALNMLIRNFAIETSRKTNAPIIVGLQPGTTDTPLSAPFQRNVPPAQLQTPAFTAEKLIEVMCALQPQDSGGLFDFLGMPFEP
jgi:NAD(P)-dependent dehydrogenase (short-subunit alcohol dehydrogenase family)